MTQSMNRLVYLTLICTAAFLLTALFLFIFSRSVIAGPVSPAGVDACFVSLNNNISTDYQSADASAVQTAVNAANPNDVLKIAGDCVGVNNLGVQTQTVYITKPLTLRGGYNASDWTITPNPDLYTTTLSADRNGRVLLITGTIDVTLENLHITGGDTTGLPNISPARQEGGGVWSDSNVTITNSKVISNIAGSYGGGIAIRVDGSLNMYHSEVLDNIGADGGGVLLYQSDISQIIGSRIAGNHSSGYGGGLHDDGKDLLLQDTIIENNEDNDGGGGMWSSNDGTLTISNTHFIQNKSVDGGGALFENDQPIYIVNSSFISNTVDGNGGGLYFSGVPTSTIVNSEFRGNEAQSGAGIYSNSSSNKITIIDSNFSYNRATRDGGSIYSNSFLTLNHSIVFSNTAVENGGGLYNGFNATAVLNNSTFDQNYAEYGGGVYIRSKQVTVDNSTIINNIAIEGGGGIHNYQGALLVQNGSVIDSNTANGEGGGGILFDGDDPSETTTIRHSTISNNISNGDYGAGIYASDDGDEDATLLIEHTVISGNINYDEEGSGVVAYGPKMTITHSAIVNNINYEEGDAGVGAWSPTTIINSTISGNQAPNATNVDDGAGGLGIYETTVTLTNVTIANNSGAYSGGISDWGQNGTGGPGGGTPSVLHVTNAIIADNSGGTAPDCNFAAGTLDFQSAPSILEDTMGCLSINNSLVQNVDPLLGTLANNGGNTWTHSLPSHSPAVDVVSENQFGCGMTIVDDQRGEIRPFDGNKDGTAACDLGAYELVLNFIYLPSIIK